MQLDHLNAKNPYVILGVPRYANARQLRAAYAKRMEMLNAYRFDKGTQSRQWQVVNEILQEVNDAYAQALSLLRNNQQERAETITAEPVASLEQATPTI